MLGQREDPPYLERRGELCYMSKEELETELHQILQFEDECYSPAMQAVTDYIRALMRKLS